MGEGLKLILSNSLKSLEQGAFQEFCLFFLPLYDKRFKGLERHGGTAGGKTRKGTPDLIRTTVQGKQIAVQCSTEEVYWVAPSDPKKTENWKPIKDISRCLEDLKHLKEIVLCSNQEIPTSQPNIKSEISKWAKARTGARITFFSISNFETEILNNRTKYLSLIEQYLPELNAYIESYLSHTTLKTYRQRNAPLSTIEEIVRRTASSIQENVDLYSEVLEITSDLKSRFQRSKLPEKGSVKRVKGLKTLCPDTAGKILGVIGVPKIGKTTWVSQFCDQLDASKIEVLWFDAPYSPDYLEDFHKELGRAILGKLFTPEVGNDFAEEKIYLTDMVSILSESTKPSREIQVIIDNADNISSPYLREIQEIFQAVRRLLKDNPLGIIFVGNKSLKSEGILLDEEFYCPSWDEEEIAELLRVNDVSLKDDLRKISRLLGPFCCGHPLVALAIARQAPSIEDLLTLVASKGPALFDKELTEEVKNLLFSDLLSDADEKNLVLRISPLIYPAKRTLLSHLGEKIDPALRSPLGLLTEKLKGNVLEGNDSIGYQIPPVFRKVSQQYLTTELRLKIYRVAGEHLLQPKGKTLDAMYFAEGITYAVLGNDLMSALVWAFILLFNASRKLTKNQVKSLLIRLWVLEALKTPSDDLLKIHYSITLFQMAMLYQKIGENQRVIELHRQILCLNVVRIRLPDKSSSLLPSLIFAVRIHMILNLAIIGDLPTALKELDAVRIDNVDPHFLERLNLPELATALMMKGEVTFLPKAFLLNQIETARLDDDERLGGLVSCFCHVGVWISETGVEAKDVLKIDKPSAIPLWDLMVQFTLAQCELQKRNPPGSIKILDRIEADVETLGIKSKLLQAKITQMKGDAFFISNEVAKASEEYKKSLHFLPSGAKTFDHAWAHFRIGECADSDSEAFTGFSRAYPIFELLGLKTLASKAKGEMAVSLYQKGDRVGFVKIIEELVREYYLKKSLEYGPSVAIGLALLTRLKDELKGETQKLDERYFPKFKRGNFISVLEDARPNPGLCTAFYSLGETYRLLDDIDRSIECLNEALEGKTVVEVDSYGKGRAGVDLVSFHLLEGNFDKLANLLVKLLASIEPSGRMSDSLCAFMIFQENENSLKQGVLKKASFWKLLEALELAVGGLPDSRKFWWLAEIYKRKAGIDSVTKETDYDPNYLRKSWEYAKAGDNFQVLTQVGHQLSFLFCQFARSIKELAQMQLSVVLGICHDQGDIKRLKVLGSNLAKFWRDISYRRLMISELPYLDNLRDRARKFEGEDIPMNLRSPLMILLLLKVSGNLQNEKFRRAMDWAFRKLEGNWDKIPEKERIYLQNE